ncbi:MAG: hypothetical protein HY308_19220 [Gammaproteobacteria bacterium]|nr:hypothetical protein [Gammaproteobacteria bacterium]
MKMKIWFLLLVANCGATFSAQAEYGRGFIGAEMDPQTGRFKEVYRDWKEGIVFDANSGNYIVTYKGDNNSYYEVIFEPATKVKPVLKPKYDFVENTEAIRYQYQLENGKTAKQSIAALTTAISNLNSGSPIDPTGWHGTTFPDTKSSSLKLDWSYAGKNANEMMSASQLGIAPGKKQSGFVLESDDLPGVAVMEIRGRRTTAAWLGSAPEFESPLGQQIAQLESSNFVPCIAAVPRITIPSSFDGAVVLDALRIHVTKDMVDMKVIESTLASQLDRLLQAAAEAIRHKSIKLARDHLHEAFVLMQKNYPDIEKEGWDDESNPQGNAKNVHAIDSLAARVIAFDVKYVEKRLPN